MRREGWRYFDSARNPLEAVHHNALSVRYVRRWMKALQPEILISFLDMANVIALLEMFRAARGG